MAREAQIARALRLEMGGEGGALLADLADLVDDAQAGNELGHLMCAAGCYVAAAGSLDGAVRLLRETVDAQIAPQSYTPARAAAASLCRIAALDLPWARHRVHADLDRGSWATDNWLLPVPDGDDLDGRDLLRAGWAAARSGDDQRAERLLAGFVASQDPRTWEWYKASRLILELLIDAQRMPEAITALRRIVDRDNSLEVLIEERMWRLALSTSCLASRFGADETMLAAVVDDVVAVYRRRRNEPAVDWKEVVRAGRASVPDGAKKSMAQAMAELEEALRSKGDSVEALVCQPATADQIRRLGEAVTPLLVPTQVLHLLRHGGPTPWRWLDVEYMIDHPFMDTESDGWLPVGSVDQDHYYVRMSAAGGHVPVMMWSSNALFKVPVAPSLSALFSGFAAAIQLWRTSDLPAAEDGSLALAAWWEPLTVELATQPIPGIRDALLKIYRREEPAWPDYVPVLDLGDPVDPLWQALLDLGSDEERTNVSDLSGQTEDEAP